jgi:hypothetical protein
MDKRIWLGAAVVVLALAAAGALAQGGRTARDDAQAALVPLDTDVTYQALTFNEMATQAGAILAGRVTRISPTRWNQDGGAYWEEVTTDAQGLETIDTALPYYEIELAVSEPIVDAVGLDKSIGAGQPVVLTVIGMSPDEDPDTAGAEALTVADGSTRLRLGDSVVVFAAPTRMAWRDGSRPILAPMGEPEQSYIRIGGSGTVDNDAMATSPLSLDQVKDQVMAAREGGATE